MKALKPTTITLIILLFFNLSASSQDIIVRANGTRTEAKIVEVDYQSVSYYRTSDPEKTVFKLDLNYVTSFIYEDGKIVNFDNSSAVSESARPSLYKNTLQSNLFGLVGYGNLSITYERLLGNGSFSYFGEAAVSFSPFEYEIDEYNYFYPADYLFGSFGNTQLRSAFYMQTGFLINMRRGLFRFSTGFSFLTTVFKTAEGHKTFGEVVFNNQARLNISEQFGIYLGYDIHFSYKYAGNSLMRLGVSYSF